MIGTHIAHYKVTARLGAGGMGEVYRATDTKLGRDVALKLLPPKAIADPQARARLLEEARHASALNHPHICHVYEVNEAQGLTYIAMELAEGQPLAQRIPEGGLPAETLLRFGEQISAALAHAHERGIIHRDLKSANVMITAAGQVKVLDFGLAQRLRGEELEAATRSRVSEVRSAEIAGTLAYMAPEVLSGEPASESSDIWSLGVLLYEMAAGKMPFSGATGYELTAAILRETPAPLPAKTSAGLRGVIDRCLAKEPAQRYQRASELRAALEALRSGIAVAVALPAKDRGRPRWLTVKMWPLVAVLLMMTVAIVFATFKGVPVSFFVGSTNYKKMGGPRLSTSGKPSANAEANEYFDRAMVFLPTQFDLLRARQMLERALELDPLFAEARAWYGFTHWLILDSGYSNDTSWLYKSEEELRRALKDDPNSGRVHATLAGVYLYQGRKELLPGEIAKALAVLPNDANTLTWQVLYDRLEGDYDKAKKLCLEMLARDALWFPARLNLGILLQMEGDLAGAIREQRKILEQSPRNIYGIEKLARAYLATGDLKAARQVLETGRADYARNFRFRGARALLLLMEGQTRAALREMDAELLKWLDAGVMETISAAEFFALAGDNARALDWLDRSVRNGNEDLRWLQHNPLLKSIRNEPRFKQILDSIAFRRQQRQSDQARPVPR
jgi:tetratricopeptide (TPR) repeat protein